MNITYKAENPDDIEFSLNVTMKLSQWKVIAKRLDNGQYHGVEYTFREGIQDAVRDAEGVFLPELKEKKKKK